MWKTINSEERNKNEEGKEKYFIFVDQKTQHFQDTDSSHLIYGIDKS